MALVTSKYKVMFYHKTIDTEHLYDYHGVQGLPWEESRRCTIAKLFEVETNQQCGEYVSVCNPLDNFNKSLGRKSSLAGLLCYLPNKEERKEIWNEYYKQFPRRNICHQKK
jgi:hypothetical protein